VLFKKIYLDTNVFIKAFEGSADDALAHGLISMFEAATSGRQPPFVTSHITLAEMLIHPFRNGDTQAQQRYTSLLSSSGPWLQIRAIDQQVLVLAARLRGMSSLKLPDAIHAATAMLTDCSHVLSHDTDFTSVPVADRQHLQPLSLSNQSVDDILGWLRA